MDILTLLRNKNEQGLSMLYDRYAQALLGIILSIVQHRETSEEILQETFLKVWNNIDQFQEQRGTLCTWMATIARHKAIDKIRLKGFARSEGLDDQVNPVIHQDSDLQIDTARLLSKLEKHQQDVLNLVYLKGYSQQQAADVLDIPLGTVKTRIRSGLAILRNELSKEKNLFFGSLLLIILTILNLWT